MAAQDLAIREAFVAELTEVLLLFLMILKLELHWRISSDLLREKTETHVRN